MSVLECPSVLAGVEAVTARGQPRHGQLVEAAPHQPRPRQGHRQAPHGEPQHSAGRLITDF